MHFNLEQLHFQKLDLNGLKTIMNWANQEGWNPGPYDADIFWVTDPDGFYGYYQNGDLIAGGFIVSYNEEFGFMGGFIVNPQYRSLGIGRKLWYQRRDMLLSRLNEGASIGMDGILAMQPFYKKGGFEIAFRDERYQKIGEKFEIDTNISTINDEDIESILTYDKQCFGFSRPQFLIPWLKQPKGKTFKYVENGKLTGYAFVRKANTGYKICPLFADNYTIAEELYKACLNSVAGESLFIDVPMINQAAIDLIKSYNTTNVFECARMYYGKAPDVKIDKIFGMTTLEVG